MRQKSEGRIFCCCCPLSCGIYIITFIIFYLTIDYTIKILFLFFNEYFDWWFAIVLFFCLLPLYWAFGLFWVYMTAERRQDRDYLKIGVLLAAVSIFLVTLWTVIYVSAYYHHSHVYQGIGDAEDTTNYKKETKSTFITTTILTGLIWLGLLIYFWFACNTWSSIARY